MASFTTNRMFYHSSKMAFESELIIDYTITDYTGYQKIEGTVYSTNIIFFEGVGFNDTGEIELTTVALSLVDNNDNIDNITLTPTGQSCIFSATSKSFDEYQTYSEYRKPIHTFSVSISKKQNTQTLKLTAAGQFKIRRNSAVITGLSTSGYADLSIPALPTYTIKYYPNGGSGSVQSYTAYYGETFTVTSQGYTRTGYSLAGWSTTSSGNVEYSNNSRFSVWGDKNLYAIWTINSYKLTAQSNNGTIASTSGWTGTGTSAYKIITYGAPYDVLPTVSRSYYSLKGWYTSSSGGTAVSNTTTMGSAATNIYAQWTPINYKISYTLNSGTASNPTSYNIETSNFTLTNPTRTGYTFKGWSGTGLSGNTNKNVTITTGSTGDRNYTANWTANTYTLTINPQSGTYNNTTNNSTKTMTYDSTTNNDIGKPTRTGYTFKGWYTSTNGGGTQVFTSTGAYNSNATSYWSSGKWCYTGNLTVYAYWTINSYTITAQANGGSIPETTGWTGTESSATRTINYGAAYGTLPTPTRNYFTFSKWVNANNTQVTNNTTIGASNVTITANWIGCDYVITLDATSGATTTGTGTIYTRYNTGIYLDSNHTTIMTTSSNSITCPTKTGYTFKGYYTAENGSGTQIINANGYITSSFTSTTFHANTTLKAYWTVNSYTLTANANGGTIASTSGWTGTGNKATKSVAYNSKYGTLPTISWTNHSFSRWATATSGGTAVTSNTLMQNTNGANIYAQWQGNKIAPKMSNTYPKVERCKTDGSYDAENKYCHVIIKASQGYYYANDTDEINKVTTELTIKYKEQTTSSYPTANAYLKEVGGSTTVQTINIVDNNNSSTSAEKTYIITNSSGTPIEFNQQKVYDLQFVLNSSSINLSQTITSFLSAAYFPIDINRNADAIGFFRMAPDDDTGLFVGGKTFIENDLQVGFTSQSNKPGGSIYVHDIRNYAIPVTMFGKGANFFFSNHNTTYNTMPTSGWWSGIHINGWEGDYNAWELVGPSSNSDQRTTPLYVRSGRTTNSWGSWRKIYDSSNPPALTEATGTLPIDSTTGTLPINRGGTGQTTAGAAASALIAGLGAATADAVDNMYIICGNAGSDNNTYYKRETSKLWNYIKTKLSNGSYDKAYYILKDSTIDLTQANNGVTANTERYFGVRDKNNNLFGLFEAIAKSNGDTAVTMTVRNQTSGDSPTFTGWTGFSINKTKANSVSFSLGCSGTISGNVTVTGTLKANNLLTLYREGTTANNYPAGIKFSVKDTTTNQTYSSAYIYAYQDHGSTTYGTNMVIHSGGGMFIGSGESPANHYSAKGASYTGEDTFITADETMYIQSTGNTIANRVGFYIDTSHQIVPCKADTATNNIGSIGTSSYKWANLYVTNINGVAVGTSPKFTDSTISTLTLVSDTGTSAITLAHGGKYKLTAGTKTVIFTMPSNPADYITEQGTSGIWRYRKWNSGVSECWALQAKSFTMTSGYGTDQYYTTGSETFPSGLFKSNTQPIVTATRQGQDTSGLVTISVYGVTNTTMTYYVFNSGVVYSPANIGIAIHAYGVWK